MLSERRGPAGEDVVHCSIQVFCPALGVKGISDLLGDGFGHGNLPLGDPSVKEVFAARNVYLFINIAIETLALDKKLRKTWELVGGGLNH